MAKNRRDRQHRGYQYPIPIDGYPMIDVCFQIPDHQRYRAAVRGQLTQLYNFYMWYNDDNDDLQQRWDVARQFTNSLTDTLQFGEGCSVDQLQVRTNPTNPCWLEYSDDGGEIWQQFADLTECHQDSANSYYTQRNINLLQMQIYLLKYIPGDQRSININAPLIIFNGDDSGNPTFFREEALCMAAQIFVGSFAARKVQELDQFFLGIGLLIASFAWITGGIGLLAGMAILGTAVPVGIHWFAARTALLNNAVLQVVACCMYDALQGQAVNQANFQVSMDSCGFTTGSEQWIVAAMVEASIQELESYLAFLDALGREYIAASIGGVNDCLCVGDFVHTFDFLISDGGWKNWAFANRPYGVWNVGIGWQSVYAGASEGLPDDERLYIERDGWDDRILTKVELFFTSTGVEGGPTRSQNLQFFINDVHQHTAQFGGFIVPDTWQETWNGGLLCDSLASVTTGASASDNCEIVCTKIIVYGQGSDPF